MTFNAESLNTEKRHLRDLPTYNVDKLVYFEVAESVESAILREKQIKGGSRKDKIELVNSINPEWRNLYNELFSEQ
jgi:predicted GIY-YIG superfamily endonuclease